MNSNKRIVVNSFVIFFRLCLMTIVGLLASRIVLDKLGASDYGLYNVVGGIVLLLNVVNSSMMSTTYRYIAFELGKGSDGDTNKVFNASVFIHGCFATLIIILGYTVGDWYVNNYVNLPDGRLESALFVFHLSVFAAAVNTFLVPFRGLLVAFENFTVSAVIDVLGRVLYLFAVLFLLDIGDDKLCVYGIIQTVIVIVEAAAYYIYSRINYLDYIRFIFVREKRLYGNMLSFSVWTLYGAVSSMGRAQGSVLLINFFFGTLVNAAYAVASQVNGFIKSFAMSLNNAAVPQITKNYSGGNQNRSVYLASYISKYTFILMSLVSFPIILEMDFLLGLWLKEVPLGATAFCQWMILISLVSCIGEGIPPLVQASGKMKVFQLVGCTYNLLGLPVSYLFLYYGAPPISILVVFFIISLSMAFVRLYLVKRILQIDIMIFIRTSYVRMLQISLPLLIVFFLYDSSSFSFFQHIAGLIFLELFLILDILMLGLDKTEWSALMPYIKKTKEKIWKN